MPKGVFDRSKNIKPLNERFWARIGKDGANGCWTWNGSTVAGYGSLAVGGVGSHTGPKVLAHRLSYEMHVGAIPEGMFVLHSCDNPPCCNPDHLSVGTQFDNMGDAGVKGRVRRGEGHHAAKLTSEQAAAIKGSALPGVVLAGTYGVSPSTVKDIRKGKVWRHVEAVK